MLGLRRYFSFTFFFAGIFLGDVPTRDPRDNILKDLFIDGRKGAKHKHKEKDKAEKKAEKERIEGETQGQEDVEGGKKRKKKEKKQKKNKEEKKNGDGLKKPLSAYMLYTTYRRPFLRKEHPCKK
jgi:hypothetical protein